MPVLNKTKAIFWMAFALIEFVNINYSANSVILP